MSGGASAAARAASSRRAFHAVEVLEGRRLLAAHYYGFTGAAGTWDEAEREAVRHGGHLVSITSRAEQDFVTNTFLRNNPTFVFWTGLTDRAAEGTFRWSSGERVTYANWEPGEPNDFWGEDYVSLNWHHVNRGLSALGTWNDEPLGGVDGSVSFLFPGNPEPHFGIVEFNTRPSGFPRPLTPFEQSVNLLPFRPSGWTDKLVVSNRIGTTSDATGLNSGENLYLDWAVTNAGAATPGSRFYTQLYVDGVARSSWSTDWQSGWEWTQLLDYKLGAFPPGRHALRIVTDSTRVIGESNESDNEYTKYVTVAGGSIRGSVFNDLNGNGRRDGGEAALGGVRVFLDANRNGLPDAGEATASSDSGGNYAFTSLSSGTFRVRAAPGAAFDVTAPAGQFHDVTLRPGQSVSGYNFGVYLDENNRISTARPLGRVDAVRAQNAGITEPRDVDVYSFSVDAGQMLAFDVDTRGLQMLDSYVQVFDSAGRVLSADSAFARAADHAPYRDDEINPLGGTNTPPWTKSAYLEWVFDQSGTYYVAISGDANRNFNPVSGTGDAVASTGLYSLTVTPMTRTTTSVVTGTNKVAGVLMLPNPQQHLPRTDVFLQRIDPTGAARGVIEPNRKTWVVIHGRADSSASFRSLAGAIEGYDDATDQVVVLDWQQGADDNHVAGVSNKTLGLDGAAWTPLVGQWAASVLRRAGIPPNSINLVGHSWGTYVAYELAKRTRGVNRIVALDPARTAWEYDNGSVNFDRYSGWSWAFYGGGGFGSAKLSGTANESFVITYSQFHTTLAAHGAPVRLFYRLVRDEQGGTMTTTEALFGLSDLLLGRHGPWRNDRYSGGSVDELSKTVFEARFTITEDAGKTRVVSIDRIET